MGRQREDLKAGAVEGEEICVDERVPRRDVVVECDLQRCADAVVGVVADAVAVAGQHEEEVERALGVAERYLELNPDDLSARLNRASGLMALGRRDEAFAQARSVIESGSQDQRILYNTACFYSLAGEVELALETLTKTVDAGYAAADWVRNDSDLDNIREDPRFEQLLEQMEANSREESADGDSSGSP